MNVTYQQAVLLGLLQGLTEFLPVSSTAHMAVVPRLLNWQDPGAAFSAIVQLGPIVAIIAYFRKDLMAYVRGMMRQPNPRKAFASEDVEARLGWYTLLGTIPLAVFGLLLEKKIDTNFRSLYVIATSLILLALVLAVAERVGKRNRDLSQLNFGQSQTIGWAQALALIPGTSRSGVTITAGLFQGLNRESAARFSFLLSIPAITAAGLYKMFKVAKEGGLSGVLGPSLVAAIVAGILAYVVIRWFLGYMKEHNTGIFIGYRIVLGLVLLALLLTHRLEDRPPVDPNASPAATSALVRIVPLSTAH